MRRRIDVLREYNFRCSECGNTRNLQVHHCHYLRGRMAWEYPKGLLIAQCDRCHEARMEAPE
jgi:5-methylcytosine-specific restriction endonuclease McrA